jgi:hypothetical protein
MTNPGLPATVPPVAVPEMGKLAREMAMDMREKSAILADYRLSDADYDALLQVPAYVKLLTAFTQEWNSALSTHDRIKFQAAYALEDGLPTLSARMGNKDEPLSGAVETGKLLARLAGVGEAAVGARSGEKFTINISLGGQKITFENEIRPVQPLSEGNGETLQIPAECEEGGGVEAVRQITEGTGEGLPIEPQPEGTPTSPTLDSK